MPGVRDGQLGFALGGVLQRVRSLSSGALSTADRQAACACLKSMTGRLGGNMRNAASIPSKCGVNVGVPISPNFDCANYTNSSFLYVLIVNHALITLLFCAGLTEKKDGWL